MTLRLSGSVLSWVALTLGLSAGAVQATELIYTPVNPMFGGNPLNGPVLLNNAQAQNNKKDPDAGLSNQKTPLQQFNETLQRSILSRVSAAATQDVVNASGKLIPGTIETADFIISIVAVPNTQFLEITTTDKATGQATAFQVGQ
jgi:curli production assembly/transport component CsgF